jgi:hypothetical protein
MNKMLNLEDLITKKQAEREAKEGENVELEGFYDLVIPPGTVKSIIYDLVEEFDVEPIIRKMPIKIANSEEREVLVLRGSLEQVQAAEKFLYEEMSAWLEGDSAGPKNPDKA